MSGWRVRLRQVLDRAGDPRPRWTIPPTAGPGAPPEGSERRLPEVVAIHPPDYLGVARSTRRLFSRSVAVGAADLLLARDRARLLDAIEGAAPEVLLLSGLVDGYDALARAWHARDPRRSVLVLWHGTPLQLADAEERRQYDRLLALLDDRVVRGVGFFKTGQGDALRARGLPAYDVFNPPPDGAPARDPGGARTSADRSEASKAPGPRRLGLFFAGPSWRKNPYAMLEAAARRGDVALSGVLDRSAQAYARTLGLRLEAVRERPWPADALASRLACVDLNLYVTLSECSPLLPLESLHLGVPCLVGSTSHLFAASPLAGDDVADARAAAAILESRLVVSRADDPAAIAAAIGVALDAREEIVAAYGRWQGAYDRAARQAMEAFVRGAPPSGARS